MVEQLRLFEDPRRLHPKWGYDLDKVASVECLRCGLPIGAEEYVEETIFSKFGQMLFLHKRCATDDYMGRKRVKAKCGPNSEGTDEG